MCWEHPCGKCGGPPFPIESYAKNKKQYLMIGDSVSILYFQPVNASLTNSSNVMTYHAPINCGPTGSGQKCVQEWLGTDLNRWDGEWVCTAATGQMHTVLTCNLSFVPCQPNYKLSRTTLECGTRARTTAT